MKRKRYGISCIDDLPDKLRDIDLTETVLAQSDNEDYAGLKTLFEEFYHELIPKVQDFLIDPDNEDIHDEYLALISEHILRKLHSTIWSKQCRENESDRAF